MRPEELTAARVAAGLTTTQLAAAIGVHERTITRYESGDRSITGPVELAIRTVLGDSRPSTIRPHLAPKTPAKVK